MADTDQVSVEDVDGRKERLDFVMLLVVEVEDLLYAVAAVDLVHYLTELPDRGGV